MTEEGTELCWGKGRGGKGKERGLLEGHVQGEGWVITEGVGMASIPPTVLRKRLQ